MTIDTLSITHAAQEFLDHTERSQSGAIAASYQQALRALEKFLLTSTSIKPATAPVAELAASVYSQFLAHLQEKYSPETEHAYSRAVLAFIKYSQPPEFLDTDQYAEFARLITQTRRKKLKTDPEIPFDAIYRIQAFVDQYPIPDPDPDHKNQRDRLRVLRDKALIFTIIDTGLKPSEIAQLRNASFNPDAATLLVDQISLPLHTITCRALSQYLRERDKNADTSLRPLFARHDKRASTNVLSVSRWTVGNVIAQWVALAGSTKSDAGITPSLLRHHFVAATLAETNDIQLTQQRARHKHGGTTRHYLKTNQQSNEQ